MPRVSTYVYCLVRSPTRPILTRAPSGVPGSGPVEAIEAGRSLWLIVSDVPFRLYGPEPLESSLRDLRRVSEIALLHEAVVEYFARRRGTTAIPMKLFTMFSSAARAVAEMQARRGDIDAVLKRIAGCEEWGVRVARLSSPPSARRPLRASSGTAFLAARRQARDQARRAAVAATRTAQRAYETLGEAARDARRETEAPAGADAPPLLDATFLVPTGRRAAFKAAARRVAGDCARAGATLTLTGPWPAYHFSGPAESRQ